MKRLAWLLPTLLLTLAAQTRADVLPPDVEACQRAKAGDKCTGGTCQMTKCSKLDYTRDASSGMPATVQYDCLKCVSAANADGGSEKNSDSGCSVARATAQARPVAPWLLAGGFATLVLRRRRRS
jgi:hypothetical protein